MKKIIVTLLTLLAAVTVAFAVPALRGKFKYTQPDGTVITLENHGDEYYHWKTDESGNTVEMDENGFYRIVPMSPAKHQARYAQARSRAPYRAKWSSYEQPYSTNFGDRKILCLLAEFQPEVLNNTQVFSGKYTVEDPQQHFWDMLNKSGYDFDGAFGSVRDYYMANSLNQYRPSFDVFGPVTLEHPESYYDENGVSLAILEIYEQLKTEINIADYDTDNDGNLDMVLFYYPGHNEAEGAPEWTIWPHQSTGYFGTMGGKNLVRYFCTSELRESEGTSIAAIGTTCHEFAHSLGLPDFYDVGKAADGGENSSLDCTFTYDLMCYGNYNDDGRLPPYLTSLERNMLGWMPMPEAISASGDYTLSGIENNTAYRINGRVEGEYFLLECRTKENWDSDTPMSGLVVFHVDQSSREIASGVTSAALWNTNNINSYGGHPCYAIVPSISPIQYLNDFAFPGRGVRSYSPTDWDGEPVGVTLSSIKYSSSSRQVSFVAGVSGLRQIFGYVTDAYGQPIQDVAVVRSPSLYEFAAPAYLQDDQVCMTDANGYYSFALEESESSNQVVSARKDGYVSRAYNVSASASFAQQDFVLLQLGEAPPASLKRYDPSLGMVWGSHGNRTAQAVGMRYSANELSAMNAVGSLISQITFLGDAENGESVYLVVDFGNQIALRQEVTSLYTAGSYVTVDVSDKNLRIPEGQDVYIGYGFTGIQTDYPFPIYGPIDAAHGGNWFWGNDFLNSTSRNTIIFGGANYDFIVSARLSQEADIDFASYGVSYIQLVNGVPEVVSAAGKTVYSVTWYVDETAVEGTLPAVSELSPGPHTYKAVLAHYDGTSERVYYDVTKE